MTSRPPLQLNAQQRRAFWLRHLHQWHWISAAVSLMAMLLFAATGITLHPSADIEAHPVVSKKSAQIPASLLATLTKKPAAELAQPQALRDWLAQNAAISVGQQSGEWSPEEVDVALPRPGGDAWLRI
ncbi:MAG: PepSY-associated TM helix domain-containing protein, partial [Undibacterium sp.]|nr:PepSY-associated TM helix domain-containing protein [Undibacterium sp.]